MIDLKTRKKTFPIFFIVYQLASKCLSTFLSQMQQVSSKSFLVFFIAAKSLIAWKHDTKRFALPGTTAADLCYRETYKEINKKAQSLS